MNNSDRIDILAFGAHPDDVELGCGGSLLKLKKFGYRTAIIDLTEGEMGSRGSVKQRYQESAKAAEILKIDLRKNLKIADGNIKNDSTNRDKIIREIRQYRPLLVFAPYAEDRHPDHIHTSHLITEGCFYSGLRKMLPEIPPHRPHRVIYYMAKYEFSPSFIIDISPEFSKKITSLQAYESQFYNPEWPEQQTFISSQGFMESIEFRARYFGWMAGVKYGEPFWIQEPMAIDNPVPIFARNIV